MKLTISSRIVLLLTLAVAVVIVVGLIGFLGGKNSQDTIRIINSETTPRAAAIDDLKSQAYLTRVFALRHSVAVDDQPKAEMEKLIAASRLLIAQRLKEYDTFVVTSDATDQAMFAKDRELFDIYFKVLDKLLELSRANNTVFIRVNMNQRFDPAAEQLRIALEAHQKHVRAIGEESGKVSEASAARAVALLGITMVLGAAAITAIGFVIRRSIVSGLIAVQTTVTRIESDLNFALRVPVRSQDELGKMAAALNSLLERLQTSLRAISESAVDVASASTALTESSAQVERASEAQSSSAANIAASVEQLTVSICHVGDRANDTRLSTIDAGHLAQTGKAVIEQTVSDIKSIAEAVQQASELIRELGVQSDRISTVVAVIREVADQTNLLALNAAIEAARAGEQGRGFAVVADEVRKLAERTAKSTQEITAMVDAVSNGAKSAEIGMNLAVERVAAGVARTDQISDSILKISESSDHTVEMVNEISNAIREQGSASSNIAQHVENVAQLAEECSATATGSADSARQLNVLAAKMSQIVAAYTL